MPGSLRRATKSATSAPGTTAPTPGNRVVRTRCGTAASTNCNWNSTTMPAAACRWGRSEALTQQVHSPAVVPVRHQRQRARPRSRPLHFRTRSSKPAARRSKLLVKLARRARNVDPARNPALAILGALHDARVLAALGAGGGFGGVHDLLPVGCFCDLCHASLLTGMCRQPASRGSTWCLWESLGRRSEPPGSSGKGHARTACARYSPSLLYMTSCSRHGRRAQAERLQLPPRLRS